MVRGIQVMARIAMLVFLASGTGFALDVMVTHSPYRAVPDDGLDDSAAFAGALNAIVTAGGGTLTVPCGNYHFTNRITVDLAAATVTMRGDGTGISIIHCANTNGLFWFNNTSNSNQLTITGITFMADQAGAGTSVQVSNPSLTTAPVTNLLMDIFNFMSLDEDCYFVNYIVATNLQQPQFINFVIVNGIPGPSIHGIRIDGVNSPVFNHGYTRHVGIGIYLTNAMGNVVCQRVYQTGVNTGLLAVASSSSNCTVTMKNCHTSPQWKAVHIIGASQVGLFEGMAYVNSNAVAHLHTDYTLENCSNVSIQGCNFHQSFFSDSSLRTMIHLKGNTSGVLIKNVIFNAAGATNNATAVRQDPGVSGVTNVMNIVAPKFIL